MLSSPNTLRAHLDWSSNQKAQPLRLRFISDWNHWHKLGHCGKADTKKPGEPGLVNLLTISMAAHHQLRNPKNSGFGGSW